MHYVSKEIVHVTNETYLSSSFSWLLGAHMNLDLLRRTNRLYCYF